MISYRTQAYTAYLPDMGEGLTRETLPEPRPFVIRVQGLNLPVSKPVFRRFTGTHAEGLGVGDRVEVELRVRLRVWEADEVKERVELALLVECVEEDLLEARVELAPRVE